MEEKCADTVWMAMEDAEDEEWRVTMRCEGFFWKK
jgi:hypothetical protein